MIDSFVIENFRLFRRLEIARFGRVNLFVGKNNSGKSALLEALELYVSNASSQIMRSLVTGRQEDWSERDQQDIQQNNEISLRHLFRGHILPAFGADGMVLGLNTDKTKQIRIMTAAFRWISDEEGVATRKRITPVEIQNSNLDIEFSLIVQEENNFRRLFRKTSFLSEPEPFCPFQVVPTSNITSRRIASLWDIIGLTPLADEVINGLKLIEPSIIGILFVNSNQGSRIPLISNGNTSEPFPMKSMGDGMTRLFHIIVALVNAKNGIVLIDEFENGLHWSVQPTIWKAIFRLAEQLNVQVFATTHSRDCVSSFENAWAEYPEQGAFFRLQLNKENESSIKAYSLETLMDSLDTDVEVR